MTEHVKYKHSEPYSDLPTDAVLRPYLSVRIQSGGRFVDTLGLVDSGADSSMFHLDFARVLGLDLNSVAPTDTLGIGGTASVWTFQVNLTVLRHRFPASVSFSGTAPKEFGLLGRADFLHAFRVGFDQRGHRALYQDLP